MSIKLDKSSAAVERLPVEVPNGQEKVTLFACEIGYLASWPALMKMRDGDKATGLAMLVAESIVDKDGNKFTLEEVLSLKREVGDPLLDAVITVNKLRDTEKN